MSLIIRAGNRLQLSAETDKVNSALVAIEDWYFPLLQEELGVEEDTVLGWMESDKWFTSKESSEVGWGELIKKPEGGSGKKKKYKKGMEMKADMPLTTLEKHRLIAIAKETSHVY